MAVEIQARCINALPEEGGTSKAGNAWRKKTWIVETLDPQYPKQIAMTAMGDRIDRLNLECGKSYALNCDIASREFNGRWYTDVSIFQARELDGMMGMGGMQQGMQQGMGMQQPMNGGWAGNQPQQPAQQPQQELPPFGTPANQNSFGGDQNFGGAPANNFGGGTDDLPF